MRGSGLREMIVWSGGCSSGSTDAVLAGKHYNHALYVHKVVLEALEWLILQTFLKESKDASDLLNKLSEDIAECRHKDQLKNILENPSAVLLLKLY